MRIEKLYSITNGKQLWRILISDTEKLFIETRDKEKKEVFFSGFILESGEPIFENYQFEEKFWIGIEKIYKDILYLHKYPKPDLPGHKGIIAFDSASQKTLWTNSAGIFQFVYNDKVYVRKESYDEVENIVLDYLTGEPLSQTVSIEELNRLYNIANDESDAFRYEFPEILYGDEKKDSELLSLIEKNLNGKEYVGNIEYCLKDNLLCASVHIKKSDGTMKNLVFANNLETNEVLLEQTANDNLELFAADTFFMYDNYFFLLKEKKILEVYQLSE